LGGQNKFFGNCPPGPPWLRPCFNSALAVKVKSNIIFQCLFFTGFLQDVLFQITSKGYVPETLHTMVSGIVKVFSLTSFLLDCCVNRFYVFGIAQKMIFV